MGRGWERGTAAIQDLGQGSGALGCQDLQSRPPFQMLQIPNFLPFPGIQTPGSHFCVIPNFLPFPRIQTPGSRFCVIPKFLSFSCYSKFSSFPGNPNLSSHFCVIPDFLSFLCYSKFPSVPQESKPQVPIFLLFPFSPFLCYSHFPISVLFPFSLIFFCAIPMFLPLPATQISVSHLSGHPQLPGVPNSRISKFQPPIFGAFPTSSPAQTSKISISCFPPPEKTKKSQFLPFPPKIPRIQSTQNSSLSPWSGVSKNSQNFLFLYSPELWPSFSFHTQPGAASQNPPGAPKVWENSQKFPGNTGRDVWGGRGE